MSKKASSKSEAAAAPAPAPSQEIASKDMSAYRSLSKHYDSRQYKKGLKAADLLLKKYPEHGETLCMRGLFLQALGKKEEGIELVKRGVRLDIMSSTCWHVLGLVQRNDRNYAEAAKAFSCAIKYDKTQKEGKDTNLARELCQILVHLRDFDSFLDSRRKLLSSKPSLRQNWMGFILANYLVGDYQTALSASTSYHDTLENEEPSSETSEMAMFHSHMLEKMGDWQAVLDYLASAEREITEKQALLQTKGRALLQLGRLSEAEAVFRLRLKANPENLNTYLFLAQSMGIIPLSHQSYLSFPPLSAEKEAAFLALLNEVPSTVAAPRRLQLNFTTGATFKRLLTEFLKGHFKQGIPSTFQNLRNLYADSEKVGIIFAVVTELVATMKAGKPLATEPEPSETLVCALVFLAQHQDKFGDTMAGLATLEEAIAIAPTNERLFLCKARLLKHAGNFPQAAAAMEAARNLDLADRYINNKTTKYLIRADDPQQAEKTISLFCKQQEPTGTVPQMLFDMQVSWYEIEMGASLMRRGLLGQAIRQFQCVQDHFEDYVDDQFDFHAYAVRSKLALRNYVDLLSMEDRLLGHPFYQVAAMNIVRCLVKLFENPPKSQAAVEEDMFAHLPPAEAKKALSKYRRQQKEEAQRAAEAAAAAPQKKAISRIGKKKSPVEDDPDGSIIEADPDPLGRALRYVNDLQSFSGQNIESQHLAFAVQIRRKKFLLALRALNRAAALNPTDPTLHRNICQFCSLFEASKATLSAPVVSVVEAALAALGPLSGASLPLGVAFCSAFAAAHPASLPHVTAAAEGASFLVAGAARAKALAPLLAKVANFAGAYTLKEAVATDVVLRESLKDEVSRAAFVGLASQRFPLSTHFNVNVNSGAS